MNKREIYRNRRDEHMTAFDVSPSPNYVGMFCYPSAYLDRDAQKELRKDVKERLKMEGHFRVPDTNGKATYYVNDDAEIVLRSYYTDVLSIGSDLKVTKLWEGWSATTGRHINRFLADFGIPPISKHDWIMMETK